MIWSTKSTWLVGWKGDQFSGEHGVLWRKPPDFLALQPNGQIPVAVIDGAVLRWDREMGSWIAGVFEIQVDL